MHRRRFLAAGAAAVAGGLAGCSSLFETRSSRAPPLVDDRPDAVYVPTHVEGMQMVGTAEAGDYGVALTYSFPHRFWTVDDDEPNKVDIQGSDAVHLMTTVWDRETRTVVPNSSVSATITDDEGGVVADRTLWAMLSQNMGVHAGDNLGLDGDGTYDVDVEIGPVSARRSGAFADRFDSLESASFSLEFEQSTLEETDFRRLSDREGDRGAVDPMEMNMVPLARAPTVEELPGTVLGEATSGDAVFVATVLDSPPAGIDGDGAGDEADDGAYLALSARTPYNRYPIPFMGLSASATRDGSETFDGTLTATFDPDLGYHYGAAAAVEPTDELTLTVDAVPQIARHEGYETAFFDFEEMRLNGGSS